MRSLGLVDAQDQPRSLCRRQVVERGRTVPDARTRHREAGPFENGHPHRADVPDAPVVTGPLGARTGIGAEQS